MRSWFGRLQLIFTTRTRLGRRLAVLGLLPLAGLTAIFAASSVAELGVLLSHGVVPHPELGVITLAALVAVAVGVVVAVYRLLVVGVDRRLDALNTNARHCETGEPVARPDCGDDEIAELDARFRLSCELLSNRESAAAGYRLLSEQVDGGGDPVDADDRTRDSAGRRESDLRLRAALLKANEASRLKSEFVATMSHEIRTPMNAVLGMTELLLGSELDEKQRMLAGTAHSSGQALLRIIDDVLDFSKMEAGKLDLEVRAFDLTTCIESVAYLLASQAQRKGLGFTAFVPPELPSLLLGDDLRVRQVLTNLVGNALKFTAAGCVSIDSSVVARTDSTVAVRFEVTDTGIGMEPSAAANIFASFTQGDGSITRRYGGTGLGLAISKRLVDMMGGTIGVVTEQHLGSTFWFELPFRIADGASPAPYKLSSERVLVADPGASARRVTSDYLRAWGMQVDEAESDDRARFLCSQAAAAGKAYSLVLVDTDIARDTISTLVRELLAASGDGPLRVVLTSAFDILEDDRQSIDADVSAVLYKPLSQSVLFDCVASLRLSAPLERIESVVASQLDAVPDRDERRVDSLGHVLLVEDNLVNQHVGREQLETIGFTVTCADNGRLAIAALQREKFDIVFMDLQLPDMDGLETTRAIRADELASGTHVPIVALTADARAKDRIECLAAGMDDYLSKPVAMAALRTVLEHWVPEVANEFAEQPA